MNFAHVCLKIGMNISLMSENSFKTYMIDIRGKFLMQFDNLFMEFKKTCSVTQLTCALICPFVQYCENSCNGSLSK